MIIPFIEHINFYEWLKFMHLNGESIPDEYLPIQYIQCTGTQYIDTGLKYDKPYHYIVDCSIDDYNGCQVFGMNVNYDHGVDVYNGYYQLIDSRYNIYDTTIPAGTRAKFTIDQPTKTIYADSGSIYESYTSPGDFFPASSVYPVLLGAVWNSYTDSFYNYGLGKIYGFKYYENGELLRDMIPVIRLSDYKPGMYDKVTQTFFTNQGTGEFENPVYGYLSGNPPFTFDSNGNPLVSWGIKGNTIQSGTPTPENPIIPEGCGDLETVGDKTGQYKIPISSAGQTTPVYLGGEQSTRKIKKLVLTGEETSWSSAGGNAPYRIMLPDIVLTSDRNSVLFLSTHYLAVSNNASWSQYNTCVSWAFSGNTNVKCLQFRDTNQETLADFKTYLQQQDAAGTPVTVWYVLATEKTGIVNEPLMEIGDYADTVNNVLEIPTTSGSNTLTVDTTVQPSEVSIIYEK